MRDASVQWRRAAATCEGAADLCRERSLVAFAQVQDAAEPTDDGGLGQRVFPAHFLVVDAVKRVNELFNESIRKGQPQHEVLALCAAIQLTEQRLETRMLPGARRRV